MRANCVGLLFTAITLLGIRVDLCAETYVVSPGSSDHPIADAIEMASSGDTLMVNSGDYVEHSILINKRLRVEGAEGATINAGGIAEDVFIITADSVEIIGFRIANVGVSFLKEIAAVKVRNAGYSRILNNKIDSCFFGIYLENSNNCLVSGNMIHGAFVDEASAGNAIHGWKGKRITIEGNEVYGHRDGIYLEFVDDSMIRGNTSYNNLRYGLHFMFSNRDGYVENTFRENGAGVAVMFSRQIRMIDNTFVRNWGGASYGLLLKEISDGLIADNTFETNTIGILAEGANRLEISGNVFLENGTAIDMKGNSLDNVVTENNFIANTFEVVTNTRYSNNTYADNYWSNYIGYDLDRDGVGDVPYRPVNLFAKITDEIPAATMMLHSTFANLLDFSEKIFPQLIPEELVDKTPRIRAYSYD